MWGNRLQLGLEPFKGSTGLGTPNGSITHMPITLSEMAATPWADRVSLSTWFSNLANWASWQHGKQSTWTSHMAHSCSQSITSGDQRRKYKFFFELTLGIMQWHFYCILLTRPDPNGRSLHEGMMTRRQDSPRRLLNLAATEDRISTFTMRGGIYPWQKGPHKQSMGNKSMYRTKSGFSFDHVICKVNIRP